MRVLFGSAFWVTNTGELLFMLLAFSLAATYVERWIGTARTATVFFFGHVGATLIVAFWLWASLNFTVVKSPTTSARDVGSSYGLAALAALLLSSCLALLFRWIPHLRTGGKLLLLESVSLVTFSSRASLEKAGNLNFSSSFCKRHLING